MSADNPFGSGSASPGASGSSSSRGAGGRPQYMTVGSGSTSESAARLQAILDEDSGYGGKPHCAGTGDQPDGGDNEEAAGDQHQMAGTLPYRVEESTRDLEDLPRPGMMRRANTSLAESHSAESSDGGLATNRDRALFGKELGRITPGQPDQQQHSSSLLSP
ncbi:2644_t:CDS:2 [Scutellospora calospora]|uniref:2644_t:CDS:1 n=1 Tax=Scutellospora calospora TaxID=85575 RepID=A0ACA9N5T0_9GLOM|nr:2644_t:CDS:2 [Scutellospora calospora]